MARKRTQQQQIDLFEGTAGAVKAPAIRAFLGDVIIADNFAGGGGASTGIASAIGRAPDIAINHDPEAIAMHRANHPETTHYLESVWDIDPVKACGGKRVALAWFSPDCKHHSKAKGGKPREQKIRGLAWVAVRWAHAVAPDVIALENVEEFRDWGPLFKRGRNAGKPDPKRKGQTFRAFVRKLERLGYVVEHRLLRACDYGAPTKRRRLFLVARRDGRPIVWPAPTHGPDRAQPYRTAAECIDWSIACPSIFDRERPLADKTMARIARGIRKFVLESAQPFVIPVNHGGVGRRDHRVHAIDEPLPTITAGSRGAHAVAVPYLVHRSNGERPGQAPRIYDVEAPLGTVVAQGQKHALCTAFLAKHYGDRPTGGWAGGSAIDQSFDTITTRDHHALVAAHLIKFAGTSEAHLDASAHGVDEPTPTITAGGWKLAQVLAFLVRYNGTGDAEATTEPLGTLTTKDRYGLVTVTVGGEEYVIVDIGMRMLTPRELYRAQGFPDDYEIAPTGPNGKPLSKTAQIRMCGNSVCPPIAAAVVRAQLEAA
jgi:DNA (cytosine-5)-methyltransferase 1